MMQTRIKMKRIILITLYCTIGLNTFTAVASTGMEQMIRPCIDDQTFAVVHLNIEKLDLDTLVDRVLELVGKYSEPDIAKHLQDNLKNFQFQAGANLNDLLKAGGRDIFIVFSMYDFPYFFVAVPVHSANDKAGLSRQIRKIVNEDFKAGNIELHTTNQLILAGLKRTIERLKTSSPAWPEALSAGFQACANKTVNVVLFPSSDQHRIMVEMLPQIPSESGNITLTTLGTDLQWAALGFDGPPSISLNVTIQSPNAERADRLLTLINNLYALAGQNSEAREFIPKLDQILERLRPRRQGRRLLLNIDSGIANSIIDDFVAPVLMKANAKATRIMCRQDLSNIGKALLIYSNYHNDQFPPDLETLISKAEMPAKGLMCPATMLKDSYIYRGASITTSDTPWMIMVYDKQNNHDGGRNVLFMDTHVEWVPEERFQELIKKDNDYRREKGFPVLQIK